MMKWGASVEGRCPDVIQRVTFRKSRGSQVASSLLARPVFYGIFGCRVEKRRRGGGDGGFLLEVGV